MGRVEQARGDSSFVGSPLAVIFLLLIMHHHARLLHFCNASGLRRLTDGNGRGRNIDWDDQWWGSGEQRRRKRSTIHGDYGRSADLNLRAAWGVGDCQTIR